ncbi:hypothetical protein ACSQ8I_00070 [Marinovum sp. E06]|uniref:hypothetical protein n=1 Tax=Marinovum sp. E06 TaxID=3449225 RepID=UPI003EDC16F2
MAVEQHRLENRLGDIGVMAVLDQEAHLAGALEAVERVQLDGKRGALLLLRQHGRGGHQGGTEREAARGKVFQRPESHWLLPLA